MTHSLQTLVSASRELYARGEFWWQQDTKTQLWHPMPKVGGGALAEVARADMQTLAERVLEDDAEIMRWRPNAAERMLGTRLWACVFRLSCPEGVDKEVWAQATAAASGYEREVEEMGERPAMLLGAVFTAAGGQRQALTTAWTWCSQRLDGLPLASAHVLLSA